MSAGTRRWKYLRVVLLNSVCPVMQNIGMWPRSMIGATVAASSDVHPTTAIRLELLAIIALAAGPASARVKGAITPTSKAPVPSPLPLEEPPPPHAARSTMAPTAETTLYGSNPLTIVPRSHSNKGCPLGQIVDIIGHNHGHGKDPGS